MDFSQWIDFEAQRIVKMGLQAPKSHRADYMFVQIHSALQKAFAHGRDGLGEDDPPRSS